jgi:hypothetical protein
VANSQTVTEKIPLYYFRIQLIGVLKKKWGENTRRCPVDPNHARNELDRSIPASIV